jgi:hypothetical protein
MVGILDTVVGLLLAIALIGQSGLVQLSLVVFFPGYYVNLIIIMLIFAGLFMRSVDKVLFGRVDRMLVALQVVALARRLLLLP